MIKQVLVATMGFAWLAGSGSALAVSDAAKVGANAGAMIYCKDKFGSGDDKGKYNLLKIKTMREYDDLDSGDRAKALVMKHAGEDGDYLGDKLTKSRCDSLRKMLYLKYD